MNLYRLLTVLLFVCITSFSFANAESEKPNESISISITENQQLWLIQQIIDLNNKIILLENNIPNEIESNKVLEGFKKSIISIKNEQAELKNKISQIDVNNSQQYTSQNNRITDVHSYISIWGFIFTLFGLVLVVGSIFLGISAKATAIREARDKAEEKITNWIEEEKEKIITSVEDELKATKDKATKELNDHVLSAQESSSKLSKLSEEYNKLIKKHDEEFNKKMADFNNDNNKDEKNIEKLNKNVEESLGNKSEDEYSARDWFEKSMSVYYKNDFNNSIIYLNKTINQKDASKELIVDALYNKSIILMKQNQYNDALKVCDELLNRFEGIKNLALEKRIVRTLTFKGYLISKLNGGLGAIDYLNKLILRFSNRDELFVLEGLAQALASKGRHLLLLNKIEDALMTYDRLIKTFSDSGESSLQKIVLDVSADAAEASLLGCEPINKTLDRINQSEKREFNTPENIIVMKFLRFLADNISINEVFETIENLYDGLEFKWKFKESRDYLNKLTGDKQKEAFAIVDLIEKHQDIEVLKVRLKEIDSEKR